MITVVAIIVAIVGCANWFMVGVFGFNFVSYLLPVWASTLTYIAVGVAGAWLIIHLIKDWSKLVRGQERSSSQLN